MPQYLSDQEISDYGPEFVDVMRRVAADTAQPLNDEINRLRQAVGHVQQEAGHAFLQRMRATLDALVPGWVELNRDPRFIQWSQLPDVFSGELRKTLMQRAWDSGDPERVAACFRAYRPDSGGSYSYSPHHLLPTGQPGGRSDVAYYRPAEIKAFFDAVVAGKWRGREAEQQRLERDIMLAQKEGRVVDVNGRPISSYVFK